MIEKRISRDRFLTDIISLIIKKNSTYSVSDISHTFGIHRSTLYRAFMKTYGVSPSFFIKRYRFDVAKNKLVKDGGLSAQFVSKRLGYTCLSSFSRAFQRVTGLRIRDIQRIFSEPDERIPWKTLEKLWNRMK